MIYSIRKTFGLGLMMLYLGATFAFYLTLAHAEHETHSHNNGLSLYEHMALSSDCHNAIYHDFEEDCGHSHHASNFENSAFEIDGVVSKKQLLAQSFLDSESIKHITEIYRSVKEGHPQSYYKLKSNRGPPVL